MSEAKRSCGTCECFHKAGRTLGEGQCRALPPVTLIVGGVTAMHAYPSTREDNFCVVYFRPKGNGAGVG